MTKCYIAIDKDDTIWGAGLSEKTALKDARECIQDYYFPVKQLKTIQCTKQLYNEVQKNGYCHTQPDGSNDSIYAYWSYSKQTKIAYLPKSKTRKNVFNII